MKKLCILVSLFLLLLSSVVSAANWQWIISTDEYGYFFDTQSLRYTTSKYASYVYPETAEYWMKTVYTPSSAAELVRIYGDDRLYATSYTLSRERLNFSYKTVTYLGDKVFYNDNGKVIAYYSNDYTDTVIPGTIGDSIMEHIKAYCNKIIRH